MTAVSAAELRLPRARSVASNARLALAGDLASKAGQLAIVVVTAHVLPVAQFALLGVCLALANVLTGALDGGVATLVVRDGARDPGARGSILRAATVARLPLLAVALAGAYAIGTRDGHPVEALLLVASATVGAAAGSILALFRAAQDLRPEAWQKLASAVLTLAAVAAFASRSGSAAAVLGGLALGPALTLPVVALRAGRVAQATERRGAFSTFGAALPYGVMALATLVYYRAPTVLLGAFRPAGDTATFTVAATVAFGLLALPNAITTGLLPRLSALEYRDERRETAQAALGWTLQICALMTTVVGSAAPWFLALVFGARYEAAALPLVILLASSLLIGASGVIGTVLVAERRTLLLFCQVAGAVAVNLAAGVVLIPRFGALGAAGATVATELLALVWLARAVPGLLELPGLRVVALGASAAGAMSAGVVAGGSTRIACGAAATVLVAGAGGPAGARIDALARRIGFLRLGVAAGLGAAAALDWWAIASSYGMRVISDTPSFLALVRQMAIAPLHPVSVFMPSRAVDDPHATPYTQALALAWRAHGRVDPHALPDAAGLERFLALCGIAVAAVCLHAVFLFVRREAGSRAAWISLPVLLLLFGPAHVIWAGDLTFHGFLYGAYYPQTLATALMLYALLALDGPPAPWRYAAGSLACGATLIVHPFTGTLLAVLVCLRAAWLALERRPGWEIGGVSLSVGFLLGSLWPSYSLNHALAETGVQGRVLIGGCVVLPVLVRLAPRPPRLFAVVARRCLELLASARLLAPAGLALVLGLAAWECFLFTQGSGDPLIHSNHLSLYWVEDRWRWPLMFGAGAIGLAGLARLALRGRPLALLWGGGCLGFGLVGAAGLPLPLWWRFLLFCQVPLALGTALWLAEAAPGRARRVVVATFGATGVFKLATLLLLSPSITYFGTPLQTSYALGTIVPRSPGIVASDPFTSYFVPGVTGHRVLVVTKAHVASRDELREADDGYALLHRFAAGRNWWSAAQTMYRRGVRTIVIEKSTSLTAPDLVTFSTGATPLVRTRRDRHALGVYYYRCNRVGRLVYDEKPYAVYVLSPRKLFG